MVFDLKVEDAEYMKKTTEEIVKSAAIMARESLEVFCYKFVHCN